MERFWKEVVIGDESTYPPLRKQIFWSTFELGERKTKVTYANIYDGRFSVDGTYLRKGDYWAEIPNID